MVWNYDQDKHFRKLKIKKNKKYLAPFTPKSFLIVSSDYRPPNYLLAKCIVHKKIIFSVNFCS